MPDTPRVFKNMRLAITEGRTIVLSDEVVRRYRLPANNVSIEPIKTVYNIEKELELKVAPRLKKNVIQPNHYEKMSVGLALALVNRDIAAAIKYYIGTNKLDSTAYTTAWFLEMFEK